MESNKKNHDTSADKNQSQHSSHNPQQKPAVKQDGLDESEQDYSSNDKYLAMEQRGVTYTQDHSNISNSDHVGAGSDASVTGEWSPEGSNSPNAEAFNQDDAILRDNLDLDEDQSQSISSDIDIDTNTLDETH